MNAKTETAIKAAFDEFKFMGDIEDEIFQVPNEYKFNQAELQEYATAHNIPNISSYQYYDILGNERPKEESDLERELARLNNDLGPNYQP